MEPDPEQRDAYTLTLTAGGHAAERAFIVEQLLAFNVEQSEAYRQLRTPQGAAQPLEIFLHDERGALVGGLIAETFWGWLHVYKFWLDARVRGGGYGKKLLLAAEDEAQRRGCRFCRLDTYGYQARGFYEKLGYRVVCCYEDYPPGSEEYYLRKELAEQPQQQA